MQEGGGSDASTEQRPAEQLGLNGHRHPALHLKARHGLLLSNKQRGQEVLGVEFRRYLDALIMLPAQIVRSGRRIIFRLLNYNDWVPDLLETWAELRRGPHWT